MGCGGGAAHPERHGRGTGVRERDAGPALRAVRGCVGLHGDLPERVERDVDPPIGTLHKDRRADDGRAAGTHGVDGLLRRAARGHDVVNDEHPLAFAHAEAATELAAFPTLAALGVDRAAAELPGDLVREDDPAGRGAGDRLDREIPCLVGDRGAEPLGAAGPLEHGELLQVARGVSA